MTAHELVDALAGLAGARSVPVDSNGIESSTLVNGIEIAQATSGEDRDLRRTWKGRTKGGPTPLLLIADDPEAEGSLRALGPVSADGPLRSLAPEALLGALRRLPELSALQAVRELAEQLDHLDRAGVAGLTVRALGTEHLYRTRLRTMAEWPRLVELAASAAGEWRELLTGLGYELEQLKPRGYLARAAGAPVAVVHPVADPAAFSRLDTEGRPPEGVLLHDCRERGAPYGLLVSSSRFRLFQTRPETGSAVGRYLELDAAALAEDDRPLLGLLSPTYLGEGSFDALMRQSRAFGAELRKRLDTAIRQDVLPPLGLELGRWARGQGWDLADDRRRAELETAALTFVFRALFLLYAESAGHLPIGQEPYRRSSLAQIVQDAADQIDRLDPRSTQLSDRIRTLIGVMRTGDDALGVPPYNGDLFAPDGFEGAAVLETASLSNAALGPALIALGIDPISGLGYDFSGLEIGHLGHIYEGLLSLRLSVADRRYRYDAKRDRYVAADPEDEAVERGELLWLTDEGGRKGGGVYYTPEPLVRHLVRRGVVPAFREHLAEVEGMLRENPDDAARRLFEFRVLDPACGSAHFLVAVVDELADEIAELLGRHPLPTVTRQLDDLRAGAGATYGIGIEDAQLLRRLVLRRCVYGVDLSPMGAEIAKISLWLASFVPGLSLAYLDHNVKVGNSLIGVASAEELVDAHGASGIAADVVRRAMDEAATATAELFNVMDRTPEEVDRSREIDERARDKGARAKRLLNAWVAEPLGLKGARDAVLTDPGTVADGTATTATAARRVAKEYNAFHWPLEFPEVFVSGDGFEAIVGNPPWEELTVEELAYYARHQPGLRALAERERHAALAQLKNERPNLSDRLAEDLRKSGALRAFFGADTGYIGGAGDPDLYKFFCQRYQRLLASDGALAVVLPRSAFSAKGSADFRRWLFAESTVRRLDFLLNTGRWAFDAEPRYTVALLVARAVKPHQAHRLAVAGVADSERRFLEQSESEALLLSTEALGPLLEVPLLPSQPAADVLSKLRSGSRFPFGAGRWTCFPVAEFHETADKALWEGFDDGWPLWKGESFDQYSPHGESGRWCPPSDPAMRKARKSNPGKDSIVVREVSREKRVEAAAAELGQARVAFRDVTNRTNTRTIIGCLIPPRIFLTNKAPYLAFATDDDLARAACLGILNSVVFDWQARRFVETNVNYFILEGLHLPSLTDAQFEIIAKAAARLSCVDRRFEDFATATGVEYGPLHSADSERLRVEIDAELIRAWGLSLTDVETIFSDFTVQAISETYRARVVERSGLQGGAS